MNDWILDIQKRADAAAGKRSDDFGHDTTALRQWCEIELTLICENDIPKLVKALKVAIKALKEKSHHEPGSRGYESFVATGALDEIEMIGGE